LAPPVAKALCLVGYTFWDVRETIGKQGVKDPAIIQWCQERNTVWVHADDRAMKLHRAMLQETGIRTVWIYRPEGAMTAREQLRILAFLLPVLIQKFKDNPKSRRYRVSATSEFAKPSHKLIEF